VRGWVGFRYVGMPLGLADHEAFPCGLHNRFGDLLKQVDF
jgi:hypothetical protein